MVVIRTASFSRTGPAAAHDGLSHARLAAELEDPSQVLHRCNEPAWHQSRQLIVHGEAVPM